MLLSIIAVWSTTLALLAAAGYGLSRWLTPPQLRPYELWLIPLWGYALLVWLAYYGLNTWLNLRGVLLVALSLAALLAAWRLLRPGAAGRWPRAPLHASLAIGALFLGAALLGVIPLVRAGYLLPIGHGWDTEFYLPLAAYLQDYSYRQLPQAPPAPLLNVILAEPTSVRAIGFAYLQGMVDLLGDWSPLATFALLLALLRALSVVPVYVLARVGFRAPALGAWLGALLVGANELLLWISFNNFGMHVSSMPLIPLAVLLTLLALAPEPARASRARALAGAVAATTALTLSYHPALLAYGALAGGVGLWALWTASARLAVVRRGLLLVGGCLLLGGLAHWRAPRAFFDVYAARTPSIGGERFARPTELLGVEAFHHLPLAVDPPAWLAPAHGLALLGLLLLIAVALWRGAVWRAPALALLVVGLLYALGLRFVIAFPYGYYKGVSYLSFLPLALAGVGLGSLLCRAAQGGARGRVPALIAALLLGTLVVGMSGWSTYRLLATYRAPVLAGADVAAFSQAARALPPGTVELVDHPELRGPALGFVAIGLYRHAWIGRGQTGFALFHRPQPGTQARYALMHVSEDPTAWGYRADDALLRSAALVLYRAPTGATAFLNGVDAAYAAPVGSLQQRLDSLQVQNLTHGDYRVVTAATLLRLFVLPDRLSWQPLAAAGGRQPRRLQLVVASEQAQPVTLTADGTTVRFAVGAGVSRITTAPLTTPGMVEIGAAAPLIVRSAQLFTPETRLTPGVEVLDDTLALRTTTALADASLQTTVVASSAVSDVLHVTLEIYEITQSTPRRYAGGEFALRANAPAQLVVDLQQPGATLNGAMIPLQHAALEDGAYVAALWIYHGVERVGRVPFARFERRAGAITALTPLDVNAVFVRVPRAAQASEVDFGAARLRGWTLHAPLGVVPGAELRLSLDWIAQAATPEPLLVFAQVLGADDHKWAAWDGAAGGTWWPSPLWRAGDRLRQDLPLTLDAATPPGRYRLVVGLYRATTGERLSAHGPGAHGTLVVITDLDVSSR